MLVKHGVSTAPARTEPCGRRRIDRSRVSSCNEPYHSWICVVCLRFHPNSRWGRLPPSPHFTRKGKTVHSDFNAASWAGVDVSQKWIDVAVVRASAVIARHRWERSAEGLARFAEWLKPFQVRAAILEPTGAAFGGAIAITSAIAAMRRTVCSALSIHGSLCRARASGSG